MMVATSVNDSSLPEDITNKFNNITDGYPPRPVLWLDTFEGCAWHVGNFDLKRVDDEPQPGLHVIALESERDVRRVIRKLQSAPGGVYEIRVLPGAGQAEVAFLPDDQVILHSQYLDYWLSQAKSRPLSLEEALDIAEDFLQDTSLTRKKRNIELEELRQRCEPEVKSFDWNRYIADLEAEIHAAIDRKTDPDERLRLELKALLKESDKIKHMRRRAEIASHYRLTKDEIKELLRDLDEHAKTKEPQCMGLDELFSLPNTTVEYVIPGMLPVGETIILSASPKTGKSLLAYDAAFAVATGEDTFLGETCKQGKVLIIQCDESPNTAKARLTKRGFRPEDAPNVKFVDSFNIGQLDKLEEWLESFRPSLVLIDCLRRISSSRSISENSAEFADSVYQLKELIARYNAAGILIHHSNKNPEAVGVERVRGSSAIAGAVWGVWQLDYILKPDPNNKKRMIVDPKDPTRILSIIARDIEGERLRIELDPNNNRWINLGQEGSDETQIRERKTHEQKILDLLKSVAPTGLEGIEIKEELGLGQEIYGYLNRLLGKRLIGTRPSTRDRRSTVYFYPQPEPDSTSQIDRKNRSQGGGSGVNQSGDTPPSLSPTPTVQDAINSSESLVQQDLQDRSQIDRKIDRKSSEESVVCNLGQMTSLDMPKTGSGTSASSAIQPKNDDGLKEGQWCRVKGENKLVKVTSWNENNGFYSVVSECGAEDMYYPCELELVTERSHSSD